MLYGYVDKRVVHYPRLLLYLIVFALVLTTIIIYQTDILQYVPEEIIAISVAVIGALVTIEAIFLQIKLSVKRQLETKAIDEINQSMRNLVKALSGGATISNSFVVKPFEVPAGFWHDKFFEKHQQIAEQGMEIRLALSGFYTAIEANEIAVIHLEPYYRYLTIRVSELLAAMEEAGSKFILAGAGKNPSEQDYITAVKLFDGHLTVNAEIVAYIMDFTKILQNNLIGDIFSRKLLMRRPKPGYGTTLEVLATKEFVESKIKRIDETGQYEPSY